jgi:hypothetical protein
MQEIALRSRKGIRFAVLQQGQVPVAFCGCRPIVQNAGSCTLRVAYAVSQKGYPQLFNRFCGNKNTKDFRGNCGCASLVARLQLGAVLEPKDEFEP